MPLAIGRHHEPPGVTRVNDLDLKPFSFGVPESSLDLFPLVPLSRHVDNGNGML
jgi:hypothetical protein